MSDAEVNPPLVPSAAPAPAAPAPAIPQPATAGGLTASHAMVGVSAAGVTGALTTLLTGYQGFGFPQGLDVAHAGSAAFLIVSAGLAIYKGAAWLISWKWPSAPPLPTN